MPLRAGSVDSSRLQIQAGHFGEQHTDISLLASKLPDRSSDLGWRKNCGRNLVEQRLEDVVIAPVDQNDVCIASFQSASRGDPGKPAANNDNTLSLQAAAAASASHPTAFRVRRNLPRITHVASWHMVAICSTFADVDLSLRAVSLNRSGAPPWMIELF